MAAGFGSVFGVLIVTFFGILGGFLLSRILGLYLDGAVGGVECCLIVGLYMGMIFSIMTDNYFVAVPLLLILAGLLVYSMTQGRRIIKRLYSDQIRKFRETIESDSTNLAARGRLAEALYKTNCLDEAIAEMSLVVEQSPESKHEAFLLREYLAQQAARKAPSAVCPSCGFKNTPGRTHCYNCERSLESKTGLKKWLATGGLKHLAILWGIAVASIAAIILAITRR